MDLGSIGQGWADSALSALGYETGGHEEQAAAEGGV